MNKPFNVAFIGAGGIARTHIKYLKPLENVNVVAAADPSELSLQRLKVEYPDIVQFTDYKEMLKRGEGHRRHRRLHAQRPARAEHHRRISRPASMSWSKSRWR